MRRISSDKDTIEHVLVRPGEGTLSPQQRKPCVSRCGARVKWEGTGQDIGHRAHVSRLVSMTQVGPHGSCRGDIQQNILM